MLTNDEIFLETAGWVSESPEPFQEKEFLHVAERFGRVCGIMYREHVPCRHAFLRRRGLELVQAVWAWNAGDDDIGDELYDRLKYTSDCEVLRMEPIENLFRIALDRFGECVRLLRDPERIESAGLSLLAAVWAWYLEEVNCNCS